MLGEYQQSGAELISGHRAGFYDKIKIKSVSCSPSEWMFGNGDGGDSCGFTTITGTDFQAETQEAAADND